MNYKGKQVPFLATPYLLWIVLSLPVLPILYEVITFDGSWRLALRTPISPSGQYSAWLIIIALMATPLSMLFRGKSFPRWLVQNRRSFGVAGFSYGILHTVCYLLWRGRRAISEIIEPTYIAAWLLFLILIPLGVTSTDAMVRRLGPKWKALQRWSYVAAVLVFLHWITLHRGDLIPTAIASFVPLVLLVIYRMLHRRPARTN